LENFLPESFDHAGDYRNLGLIEAAFAQAIDIGLVE